MLSNRARAAEARAARQALEPERQERLRLSAASAAATTMPPTESATSLKSTQSTDPAPVNPEEPRTPPAGRPTDPKPAATQHPSQRPGQPDRVPTRGTADSPPSAFGRQPETDRLEPPVPLLPASAAEPLTRDQSRMAIGILIGALVLALAFAVWGLSSMPGLPGLTSGDGQSLARPAATDADQGDETGSGDEGDDASTNAPPVQSQPLTFTAAKDYDPFGDGSENPDRLPRILDGDTGSWWGSEGYRSSAFSNLKPGLGVVLDLGETSSVSAVTLELPGTSKGALYVTDDAGYYSDGKPLADDLAKAGEFNGEGSVSTTLTEGSSGRYVIVWFTEISRDGDWYRARLAGASATS